MSQPQGSHWQRLRQIIISFKVANHQGQQALVTGPQRPDLEEDILYLLPTIPQPKAA